MSSTDTTRTHAAPDDRTTEARIRDAAIECVATGGLDALTARSVAEAADVSPGLVIHHFGSMDGLREACDRHVVAVIREFKQEAVAKGENLDVLSEIQNNDTAPLAPYLAEVLADNSPIVAKLVDQLVDDAEEYMEQAVELGTLKPSENSRARAAVLTMWSLGALVMHRHVQRIFGVDPTDLSATTDPAKVAAYAMPGYEILHEGIYTDEFGKTIREQMRDIPVRETSRQVIE